MRLTHRKRIIPVLLLHNEGLVKSKKFKDYSYVGDPINAVRIFNDKEVDEIVILDIDASKNNRGPDFSMIADITSEAFMPLAYGGGITSLTQVEKLFYSGIEKVVLNTAIHVTDGFKVIREIANQFGNQSVVSSIDFKKNLLGNLKVYHHTTNSMSSINPIEFAKRCEDAGTGELMINSVNRDGMYSGYDLELLNQIAEAVSIPVIICGGASTKEDFISAEKAGASAMAAGSMFVFQRPHKAVLISYNV
ncbi:MAG: cyclase [Bacteroidia bacterium]